MRPIWSGTISFGLVSVPVKMYSATQSKEVRFHFLDRRDLTPIGYDKIRKDTGEHVDPGDIVRGFELERGSYVELTDEDLDRLDVELTRTIDICDFVALEEIDPIFFRKAYYLGPGGGAEKPYRLLARALAETGRVGIAKVVIRNKQHLSCLRTHDDVLLLETMYYADEVRPPDDIEPEATSELRPAELEMAKSLVENLTEPFDPGKYDDTYRKELLELIHAKAQGQPLPEPDGDEPAETVDLLAALKASVEQTQRKRRAPAKPARKRPARKPARKAR